MPRWLNPQDYSRRTRYRPPADWYRRISNRLGPLFTSLGLAPRDAVTLEVRGRTSGKLRRTPILRTPYRGQDYMVALAGESEWVRNVRAAGGRAVIRRRGAGPVRMVELPVEERPPIILEYLHRGEERSGSNVAVKTARYYFGLTADPSIEDVRAVARYYPVFRVAPVEDDPHRIREPEGMLPDETRKRAVESARPESAQLRGEGS